MKNIRQICLMYIQIFSLTKIYFFHSRLREKGHLNQLISLNLHSTLMRQTHHALSIYIIYLFLGC